MKAAAAAIAILGIAALAHHKHHYKGGYRPSDATETAEFERGYRDGLHGYSYWEYSQTRGYVEGYHAGENERMNSVSHRRIPTDQRASPMAYNGCANIVAQNLPSAGTTSTSSRCVHQRSTNGRSKRPSDMNTWFAP